MTSCVCLSPDRTGPGSTRVWHALRVLRVSLPPVLNMSMSAGASATTQRAIQDDTKPHRSTKLSGKLKVLPEQPEPGPVPTKRALLAPAQAGEGSNATGDSDDEDGDGDGGPDEDETEDVDVRFLSLLIQAPFC